MPKRKRKGTAKNKSGWFNASARETLRLIFARLLIRLKALAMLLAVVIFVAWLCVWGWLSGFFAQTYQDTRAAVLDYTVDMGFYVDDLLVEGRENADADLIMALLNVDHGDPIFAFDPVSAKQALEKISWIKEARVERRLPRRVYIDLTERTPMALWQKDGKVKLIDAESVVLTSTPSGKFKDMILIVGDGAEEHAASLIRLLESEPVIKPHVDTLKRIQERRWDMVLSNGIVVKLPEENIPLALRRLVELQESDQIMNRDLLAIDIRDQEKITVRTRPGNVESYKSELLRHKGNAI